VRSAGPFRRVLVGFDGSPDAAEAIRVAAALVGHDGGHVVALSVVRHTLRAEGNEGLDAEGRALRERAEALFYELRRAQSSDSGIRMSAQVVFSADRDYPGQVVTDYAAEHGFDILVLGRHGDGTRRRSRLGRVADMAAQGCPVPVLLLSSP
jgi:nucleotide-binding universal stress UspA family protein